MGQDRWVAPQRTLIAPYETGMFAVGPAGRGAGLFPSAWAGMAFGMRAVRGGRGHTH